MCKITKLSLLAAKLQKCHFGLHNYKTTILTQTLTWKKGESVTDDVA